MRDLKMVAVTWSLIPTTPWDRQSRQRGILPMARRALKEKKAVTHGGLT
jgi:hypothetical protein